MSDEVLSPSARMSVAFSKLRKSAKQIQAASDELSRSIKTLESALTRLQLRVACWTQIAERVEGAGVAREFVGYIEYRGEWKIVLSIVKQDGFENTVEDLEWAYDDAPQYLRSKAVDKLPELVEGLAATVEKTSERMQKKLVPAQQLAEIVTSLSKRVTS